MHCALAALLDEDPEGCFFVAEKGGNFSNESRCLLKTILIL